MVELSPDVRTRTGHLRASRRALLQDKVWFGTRDGGAFESPFIGVIELDGAGRALRIDIYDPHHLEQALARFAELAAPSAPQSPFANAATRAIERGTAALAARDWEGFAALMAPDLRHYDRTRIAQIESDGREWLASCRQLVEMTTEPPTYQVLATRGERLALFEMLWRGAAGDVGASETDKRLIVEVNDRGKHVAIAVYDPEDLDAAYAELDTRFDAGEANQHAHASAANDRLFASIAARDWDALAASLSPDFAMHDHRVLGWGETLGDVTAFVRSQQALFDLAPDYRYRNDHVRLAASATLLQLVESGTREGGTFENQFLVIGELDADGRYRSLDLYDLDETEQALARFDALVAGGADLGEPFANASSRADRRLFDCFNARDWPGIEALAARDLTFDERRRMVRNTCGREVWLEQFRILFDVPASRFTTALRATRGERLSLSLHRFTGEVSGGGGPLATEDHLVLHEVDRNGRIVAITLFDLEDEDAAYAELDRRFDASEGEAARMARAPSRA